MASSAFAIYETAFGPFRIACENGAVVALQSAGPRSAERGAPTPLADAAARQLAECFTGKRKAFDFPIALRGSPFQMAVWRALQSIPYGETRSYGELAALIGRPGAARAVGGACNRNPIAIAIPCHRVIRADGNLGGYAGGLELKAALLKLEREGKN